MERAGRSSSLALLAVVVCFATATGDSYAQSRPGGSRMIHHAAAHRRGHGSAHVSIVGGSAAPSGSFPYLAFVADFRGEEVGTCTGTVVASNLILTAGHCAEDPETGEVHEPSGFVVVTGNVDWAALERQVSTVSQVLIFPYYEISNPLRDWGDAALLELSTPIVAPSIRLATSEIWKGGTVATIAGWGDAYYGQEDLTEQLMWANTVVQSKSYCQARAPGFHPVGQICVINPPRYQTGTCEGDSGGPVLARQPGTSETVEIGITSIGYGECLTTAPDVATRADLVAGWVNARIAELALPSPPAPSTPPSATLPRLTNSWAKVFVRRSLTQAFRSRFNHRRAYRVSCSEVEATKRKCGVTWSSGPNDFYGEITVYYAFEEGRVIWNDRFTVHWVNDYCWFYSGHRNRCRVHTSRR